MTDENATPPPPPADKTPLWKRTWARYTATAVAGVMIGAMMSGGAPEPTESDEYKALAAEYEEFAAEHGALDERATTLDSRETDLDTREEDLDALDEDLAAREAALDEAESTPAEPEADATAEPVAETFVMPDLVGVNLQVAQDILQASGSYLLDQEDAAGLSRTQIIDSNWYVCEQAPTPGTETDIAEIVTLWSVKLDEYC